MNKDSLTRLKSIAEFQRFSKNEYICYEGQPGHEMYVVLQGAVGIYLTAVTGELTEVSRIQSGGFFGEMSIFDKMPRSASCIALEDTICISINRSNLHQLLDNCPDIVEQMLVNMSLRIRSMDESLSRARVSGSKPESDAAFVIPSSFRSHRPEEPHQEPRLLHAYKETCPLCGEKLSGMQVRRNLLTVERIDPDRRIHYAGCEPLWYEIVSCPHCFYSNHYLTFFQVNSANQDQIRTVLLEQHSLASQMRRYGTVFDRLVISYLQAIHLNERLHPADHALPGTLWLKLYWLARDAGDTAFASHCALNAVHHLTEAIDRLQISDSASRCATALSTAHLLRELGAPDKAKKYCIIAANSSDDSLKAQALTFAASL